MVGLDSQLAVSNADNRGKAGKNNIIGYQFEDLAAIIKLVNDKTRIGVCFDTCHAFAAGYDLRTPEAYAATFQKFDEIVGLSYLLAIHANDSKADFESHRDLHSNIGELACNFSLLCEGEN
jgi:AP endonuclease-1